jgi:hypothetical protein
MAHAVSKEYIKAELDRLEQFVCEVRTVADHIAEYTKDCEYSSLIAKIRSIQVSSRQLELDVDVAGCLVVKEIAREESKV